MCNKIIMKCLNVFKEKTQERQFWVTVNGYKQCREDICVTIICLCRYSIPITHMDYSEQFYPSRPVFMCVFEHMHRLP